MRIVLYALALAGLLAMTLPELPKPRREFRPAAGNGRVAAFSPNGSLVAVGGAAPVAVFQTGTGLLLRTYPGHTQPVTDLAFAPHPDTLLSADAAGQVRLWNPETLATLAKWQAPGPLRAVAFAPGGGRAVLVGARGCWLWNLRGAAGPVLVKLTLPEKSSITAVAFAPDGQRVALGFDSGVALVYHLGTGAQVRKALATTPVRSLCLHADTLLAATGTPNLKSWPLQPGAAVAVLPLPHPLTALAIEPSGRTLALGFATGDAVLWNRANNRAEYECHGKGPTNRVQFQPGGDLLLAAYEADGPKTWLIQ
ncbi:hypothetical protein [Hymenobacter sp.]|uniref:WD40 repeat domain-containing protein n=1 Tax=Hymenobacter sp. TaxID=1898978 RepID=UPI00286C905A|nr:hypothetical protein [Hymenobacter sp.]